MREPDLTPYLALGSVLQNGEIGPPRRSSTISGSGARAPAEQGSAKSCMTATRRLVVILLFEFLLDAL